MNTARLPASYVPVRKIDLYNNRAGDEKIMPAG